MNNYLIFCIDGKRFITMSSDFTNNKYATTCILSRNRSGFEENESGLRLWKDKSRFETVDERLKFLEKVMDSNSVIKESDISIIDDIIDYFKSHFTYGEISEAELFSMSPYIDLANKRSYYQRKKANV